MDRRSFMKASSAVPLALVPTVFPGGPARMPMGGANEPRQHVPRVAGPISYLGADPDSNIQRVMMALSESVFVRLTNACDHALRLDDKCDKIGSVTARGICLDQQMHTQANLPPGMGAEHPPEWDFEGFVAATNHWEVGQAISIPSLSTTKDAGPPNAAELLKGKTVNGLMYMPRGVTWCGSYIHDQTGLAMRGIGTYLLYTDGFEMRWDVLCG